MARSRPSKAQLAASAWTLMFNLMLKTTPQRDQGLKERGLTPNDSRALFSLDAEEGCPIGSLAGQWGCDPSNATFIIDRLEMAGLANRQSAPGDRRIKLVVLTEFGAQTKQELLDEFHRPPPEFSELRVTELEALARVLRRLESLQSQDDS